MTVAVAMSNFTMATYFTPSIMLKSEGLGCAASHLSATSSAASGCVGGHGCGCNDSTWAVEGDRDKESYKRT